MMDAAQAPQHMRALNRANQVRLARAGLRKRIADGSVTVAEVLQDLPPEVDSMTVTDLLMSQHRWGITRCRRFLSSINMSEGKTLGTLTQRQVDQLVDRLDGRPTVDPFASRYAGSALVYA